MTASFCGEVEGVEAIRLKDFIEAKAVVEESITATDDRLRLAFAVAYPHAKLKRGAQSFLSAMPLCDSQRTP